MNWLEKLCFVHGLYDEKFLHPTPMDPRNQVRRAHHCGAIPSRRTGFTTSHQATRKEAKNVVSSIRGSSWPIDLKGVRA